MTNCCRLGKLQELIVSGNELEVSVFEFILMELLQEINATRQCHREHGTKNLMLFSNLFRLCLKIDVKCNSSGILKFELHAFSQLNIIIFL